MNTPAIILVGYNRPQSLKRLLDSVSRAKFDSYKNIPMVISVDGDGDPEVLRIAYEYIWHYGEKEIIEHKENLGLREHIIACGDLTNKYQNLIILEDDCIVSKNFYKYAYEALKHYGEDDNIAGISLYSYEFNENAFLPFNPLNDGNSVYFMQLPCSWGQAWTVRQWEGFKEFYNKKPQITLEDKIPDSVKNWPESSWKKYFTKYLVDHEKYFVYPHISYSSNFADLGENWKSSLSFFHVPMEHQESMRMNFVNFSESYNKYDVYFELQSNSLKHFGAKINEDTCLDIYGTKHLQLIDQKYLLSMKRCTMPIKSYDISIKPLLQNIISEVPDEILSYGETKDFSELCPGDTKNKIWEKQQPQAYHAVTKSRYYKLGYYTLHPLKYFKKRLKK